MSCPRPRRCRRCGPGWPTNAPSASPLYTPRKPGGSWLRSSASKKRALFGLTNVLVMFGGSKDGAFNQEISDLAGQTRISRTNWQAGATAGRTFSGEDIAIIRPEEIRQLLERHA